MESITISIDEINKKFLLLLFSINEDKHRSEGRRRHSRIVVLPLFSLLFFYCIVPEEILSRQLQGRMPTLGSMKYSRVRERERREE